MVERIIVGIDESSPSRAALGWALHRAISTDAELVLEHVVDDEWGQVGVDYADEETAEGERILTEALDRTRSSGRTATAKLIHGSPAWTLARDAKHDDLIVVGTHKTGFLRGRVLGTRSIVVASAADCSVVVVPEENLALRHGVIVGVAPGDQSHVAIVAGAREAERLGQELSLIHVVPDTTESAEIGRALLAEAAGIASATAPGITIRRRVSRRRRSDALLDASRSASMLVLGETRVNKDRAGFIGSVTHEVLLNLTSPVMVAR